jgi:LuxR family maltose regulon positive regulatory protein
MGLLPTVAVSWGPVNIAFAQSSRGVTGGFAHAPVGIVDPPGWREAGKAESGILRQRLIDAIGLPEIAPVTLITAPAGFGKSTLAAQWAHETDRSAVWVSLHSESNTPDRFLSDLQDALDIHTDDPDVESPLSAILDHLIELSHSRPTTLVFDDYHLIENRDVHRVMNALIHELPAGVSVMILSRTLPPLALGRARVEGQAREITEVDLRFDQRDVAALVKTESNRSLSRAQIDRLTERTDGWIAGIRLALLAMLQTEEKQLDQTIDALSTHQWLDDYIVEEVLDTLPDELRNFVLRTASFSVLEPKLCDAVLDTDRSAALIDELARRLVFVRRDTRSGMGVAYHALFAECVSRIAERMLSANELHTQHLRAAVWLEQHERFEEALDHALFCEDWVLARRILRAICEPLWQRDLHHTLLYWMEKLPVEQLRPDHELLYWYIHKLFSTGQLREATLQLEIAEPLWEASGNPAEVGFMLGCRAFVAGFRGDSDAGLEYSYRALHHLPPQHWASRMRHWTSICEKEFWRGNDDLASQAYSLAEYCRGFLPTEQRWWALNATSGRVNRYALRGNLPTAERLYRLELERFLPQLRDNEGRYRYRLAAIYLEWNELDKAQAEVDRFTSDLDRFPWQFWYSEAWEIAAKTALATGQHDVVEKRLDRLFTALEDLGQTHTAERARALRAQLWLEQGELLLAGAWGDSVRVEDCGWVLTYGETDPYLVLIQLRATQDDYESVLSLAATRITEGVALKRYAELIPLYVWQAVALRALGRTGEAIDALRLALELGKAGQFYRSFFPPGVDVISFYHEAKSALPSAEAAYLDQLLEGRTVTTVADEPVEAVPRDATPAGMLSRREREILELIRDGLSSREIADRLFVGESTIKKHLTRAFLKLKVENRTSAVIRAQELGLLP